MEKIFEALEETICEEIQRVKGGEDSKNLRTLVAILEKLSLVESRLKKGAIVRLEKNERFVRFVRGDKNE